ncbi:MAG: hypothetical protein WAO33_01130 [Candidatus Nanopelagicales bacterium]|jgi:hypothetical protein
MTDENEGAHGANDLGSWLTSMGAPESITDLMPSEITGLDLAPLIAMLGGVGVRSGVRNAGDSERLADSIKWLPLDRS